MNKKHTITCKMLKTQVWSPLMTSVPAILRTHFQFLFDKPSL